MNKESERDCLFAEPQEEIQSFVFDEKVADVFEDMIERSVPGYRAIINMIGVLAGEYARKNSRCYDLGCSLGASAFSMARFIREDNVKIIAIDNAEAMIEKCQKNILYSQVRTPIEVRCQDIEDTVVENASVAVLNFTLQFIKPQNRSALLSRIHQGLNRGGILVLSDKIVFENEKEEEFQTELHHTFKRLNGYSNLEIAQKRTALENVLIPDTLGAHADRLRAAGFKNIRVWFRCFNFVSIIAFK